MRDVAPSLPVPVPPCPGCGAPVATDGTGGSCTRCGRAFALEVTDPNRGMVYRSLPVVELVPVRDHARPRLGLRIETRIAALDASVGSRFLYNRVFRSTVWLTFLAGFVAGLEWGCGGFHHGPFLEIGGLWGLLLLLVPLTAAVAKRLRFDRVTLVDTLGPHLVVRRFKEIHELQCRSIELDRIVAVRDTGAHVRLDLDDGTNVDIGEGLKVPLRTRRWLVRRIGRLLPRLAEPTRGLLPRPADPGTAARDDAWEARQLCPDEGCTGVVGPGRRCGVCGRAVEPER